MPDSCAIYRRVLTDDGEGGDAASETLVSATICRLAPTRGGGSLLGMEATGLIETTETFEVTLPVGTAIEEQWRIAYTNGETAETSSYRVIGIDERGSFATATRVICKRAPVRT